MITIKSIEITNFRSIQHAFVDDLSDLNIVVGRNDIGKSNFLKALNLFFNGETEIGKRYNFDEDFSRYAKVSEKKAKETKISIVFKTNYTDGEITWSKKWRKDNFFEEKATNSQKQTPKAQSGAWQWVRKLQYKYVPAIKGSEYFAFLMGELHDVLSDVSARQFKDASDVFVNELRQLMTRLTTDIDKLYNETDCSNEISPPSNLRNLFSTLGFTLNRGDEKIPLEKRGDGIKARHIPVILKFIAQHLKSNSVARVMPVDTIWGFEEPENNMELTTAFKAAEQFFGYSTDLQIFINTHSPAFYQLGKRGERVRLFFAKPSSATSSDTILEKTNVKALHKLDNHMGLLPLISDYVEESLKKVDELQREVDFLHAEGQRVKKPLVVTEGKTDWQHFKRALQILQDQGLFSDIDVSFMEYNETMGDTALDNTLKELGKIPRENTVIGVFDCDSPTGKNIEKRTPYKDYGHKVFGFTIPKPDFRINHEGISVEHLYKDDDLQIKNGDDRRLYLSSEFNDFGKLKADDRINVKNFEKACAHHLNENNSKIVDCDVTNGVVNNIALSKSDFANLVAEGNAPYDSISFEGFHKVFEKLSAIINP